MVPLRKLQWKLTFSYTLVTVAALLIAELILLGGLLFFIQSDFLLNQMTAALNEAFVPEAARFVQQEPPDLDGLNAWLVATFSNSNALQAPPENSGRWRFDFDQGQTAIVLDPEGRLLAQNPPPPNFIPGQRPFDITTIPHLVELIAAAAQGEREALNLRRSLPDGRMLNVLPLLADDGRYLGVFIFILTLPAFNSETLRPLLLLLLSSLALFTVAAGLIGALFGYLTARGLTRRLDSLAQAADAWSQGDFSVVTHDSAGDEVGLLSRRLNRMAEQLQNLLETRQELATLEERNRLARDLHDSVKQQVFATAMQVGAARALLERDPTAAGERLAEAEKLARQSQQELSGLIQELRPAALEGRGLADALRDYVADWSRHHQIEAQARLRGERPLPLSIEQTLFRVAQEALTNVARHSAAQTADVLLAWNGESVTLTITDNGRGFQPAARHHAGVGLASMRERVEALNGRLTIASQPGEGTVVTAEVKLVKSDE